MTLSPTSTTPPLTLHATQEPFNILRTETVLSRFPIHNLTKHGRVTIHLHWTNAQRDLDCRWDVSYNDHYGQPGPLAYKLDTLVINQRLDTLPRPLPRVLKLGSLRHVGRLLGLNASGRQQAHLKRAFHQNASAYIVAKLRYRGRDGTQRRLEAGFTRYSVLFTGERLPDGTPADAIYLVLSEPYWEVLNHAPVRPLDYTYLKALTPTAQRFYELLSYQMFAALKYRGPSPPALWRLLPACDPAALHGGRAGPEADVQSPSAAPRGGLPDRSSMTPPPTPTASPTGSCTTPQAPKPAPSIRPSSASRVPQGPPALVASG